MPVVADVSECCRDVLEVQGTLAEVGERPDIRHDAVTVGFASARIREVALGVRRRCVMDVHDGGGEALDPLGDVAVSIVVPGIEQQLEFLRSLLQPASYLVGLLDTGASVMVDDGPHVRPWGSGADIVEPRFERHVVDDVAGQWEGCQGSSRPGPQRRRCRRSPCRRRTARLATRPSRSRDRGRPPHTVSHKHANRQ